jgi:hypothetical protein
MKNILSKKLFESPDSIQALDPKYHYMKTIASFDDDDAYPFGFINGKMIVGDAGKTHFDFLPPEALNDVENIQIRPGYSKIDLLFSTSFNASGGKKSK